eukprot:4906609-Pyramimonas_sp.AAC.1
MVQMYTSGARPAAAMSARIASARRQLAVGTQLAASELKVRRSHATRSRRMSVYSDHASSAAPPRAHALRRKGMDRHSAGAQGRLSLRSGSTQPPGGGSMV